MAKILNYRGTFANLPTLEFGQLAMTSDTEEIYAGFPTGNKKIYPSGITGNFVDRGIGTDANSLAVGISANTTNGTYATAVGLASLANNISATAVGYNARAIGIYSAAFGNSANAATSGAVAVGYAAIANGTYAVAVGYNTRAIGICATSIGINANAAGTGSTSIGLSSCAMANYTIAMGYNARATVNNAIAIGQNAICAGINSIAFGRLTIANGIDSVAIGPYSETSLTAYESIAIGSNASANASKTVVVGANSIATGNTSTSLGYNTLASGANSVALGMLARCYSNGALALGEKSSTYGINSIAIGLVARIGDLENDISANNSLAIGYCAVTLSNNSVALGIRAYIPAADNDTIQLGNSITLAALKCRVALNVTSDIRDKTDIVPITKGLEFINQVEPLQYVFNHRLDYIPNMYLSEEELEELTEAERIEYEKQKEMLQTYGICDYDRETHAAGLKKGSRKRVGVSAQQVQEALRNVYGNPDYANIVSDNLHDLENIPEGVESQLVTGYNEFIPFLILAIQELTQKVNELEGRLYG